MKIAIVKLSALGDIVHAMVVLQYIKKYNHEINKTLPLVFVEKFIDLICITTLIISSLLFVQNMEIIFLVMIIVMIIVMTIVMNFQAIL